MKMSRVYNFFSGTGGSARRSTEGSSSRDAGLQGSGMSVMEMSHRSKAFDNIITEG